MILFIHPPRSSKCTVPITSDWKILSMFDKMMSEFRDNDVDCHCHVIFTSAAYFRCESFQRNIVFNPEEIDCGNVAKVFLLRQNAQNVELKRSTFLMLRVTRIIVITVTESCDKISPEGLLLGLNIANCKLLFIAKKCAECRLTERRRNQCSFN